MFCKDEEVEVNSPEQVDAKNSSESEKGKGSSQNISKVLLKQLLEIKNIEADNSEVAKLQDKAEGELQHPSNVVNHRDNSFVKLEVGGHF